MKDKLLYSAIGGCIGAALTLTLSLFSPLNAQDTPPDVHFGKITCAELEVVENSSKPLVRIGYDAGVTGGGRITVFSRREASEGGKRTKIDFQASIVGGYL